MGWVDDARWPLVVVEWPRVIGDEELEQVLAALASFYDRRHAVLHDGMRATGMTAAQRRRLARFSAAHEEDIRRSVVASAAVVKSALQRGIITMVQWAAPTPSPFELFAERAAAEEWLMRAPRRAGLWRPKPGAEGAA